MKVKLLALDIDGTLTNDEKKITSDTKNHFLQVQEKGVRLMLASARPVPGLYEMAEELELYTHQGILMAYNGGRIILASDGSVLSETSMDKRKQKHFFRYLETLPVTVILDDGKQFYVTDEKGYKVEFECRNNQIAVQKLITCPISGLCSCETSSGS